MTSERPGRVTLVYAVRFIALIAAYLILGRLGLTVAPVAGFATLVWPATGLSLAALLLGGLSLWPAVTLGAFLLNLGIGASPLIAFGIAVGNTAEAVVGAIVWTRMFGFRASLSTLNDVLGLVAAAFASTLLSATIGTTSLALGGRLALASFPVVWWAWWTGDVTSDLIVAPLLLTWAHRPHEPLKPGRWIERVGLVVLLSLLAAVLFLRRQEPARASPFLQPHVLFFPLLWVALRFGSRGVATASFLIAVPAIWGTYTGRGAFVRMSPSASLTALHVFLDAAATAGLVLAAVTSEALQMRQALRIREEQQRLAVEAARLGMWFWHIKEARLEWTPLTRSMYGVGPEEDVSYPRMLTLVHPEDRDAMTQAVSRSLEQCTEYQLEHRVVWPDGSDHWILALGCPFCDSRGEVSRMMGVAMDVTERKRAEQAYAALLERELSARKEAQVAVRAKEEFLAVLSHELRTPLQAMLGWTQLLQRGGLDEGTTRRAILAIERNVRVQARLVEDLLDVSRIVAGKVVLEQKCVDLEQVVVASLATIEESAATKGVRVESASENLEGSVVGDAMRLQQVVSNLLSNAVKFTPKGGSIHVRVERVDREARIAVADTGCGIPPEFVPYVFDRFRQAETTTVRTHGGLGLGLAIAHHLVALHGGTVQVASPGKGLGTTFTVALPLVRVGSAALGVEPTRRGTQEPLSPAPLAGKRVLVVDDEQDTCELVEAVLRLAGADVRAVRSVRAALGLFETFCPHVLLSDIAMPDEDGHVLIRAVRAREVQSGGHLPAVALSAFASPAEREQALSAGFDVHLAKPASPAALVGTLGRLLSLSASDGLPHSA